MHQPPRDDQSKQSKTDHMSDQVLIGELAECILKGLREDIQKEGEPFDSYALELRLRLYPNLKVFQDRLIQGYNTLMEILPSIN
jgi:hypothetical protein